MEKSEANGTHDGRVIACPTPRRPGRSYQRLIDTAQGGFVYDLRTPCVGGSPVVVWIKRKTAKGSFSIRNLAVTMQPPDAVFSATEQAVIGRFCVAMGADWAGLDILRERATGRLYVVDVNKTDVGPVLGLPLRDKLRSTALLGAALTRLLGERGAPMPQGQVRGNASACP